MKERILGILTAIAFISIGISIYIESKFNSVNTKEISKLRITVDSLHGKHHWGNIPLYEEYPIIYNGYLYKKIWFKCVLCGKDSITNDSTSIKVNGNYEDRIMNIHNQEFIVGIMSDSEFIYDNLNRKFVFYKKLEKKEKK